MVQVCGLGSVPRRATVSRDSKNSVNDLRENMCGERHSVKRHIDALRTLWSVITTAQPTSLHAGISTLVPHGEVVIRP